MYQQPSRKIEFRRKRDFGKVFGDSFKYLKFNYKSLFPAIILLAGPFALIAGGFSGYFQSVGSKPFNLFTMADGNGFTDVLYNLFVLMLPYYIFFFIGFTVFHAVVNRYLILSQQKADGEIITVSMLVKYLPKDVWRLFYNYLLFIGLSCLVMIVLVVLMFIPILGFLIFFFAFFLVTPNVVYGFVNAGYLVLRDEILITAAFGKTWSYMRGNYWWTWLLMVCAYIITSVVSVIFAFPQMILTWITAADRIRRLYDPAGDGGSNYATLFVIFGIIAVLGQFVIMPIVNIFTTLHFHSHEEEEEGMGLKSQIDQIGLNN